jgi:eukaryotic-like serine/threonine-protein kinase
MVNEEPTQAAWGFASAGDLHTAVVRFLEGERDVAQRKARAIAHLELADEAAARAFAAAPGDSEDRAVAMREVTQALSLDPANVQAGSTLMKLLTVPPRTLPAEAEQEILGEAHLEQRGSARIAALLDLTWFLCVPFLLMEPVVSKTLVAAVSVVFAGAAMAFAITRTVLTLVEVMVILFACMFFRRFRDARNRAEERIHLYNWQLRQLVLIPVGR